MIKFQTAKDQTSTAVIRNPTEAFNTEYIGIEIQRKMKPRQVHLSLKQNTFILNMNLQSLVAVLQELAPASLLHNPAALRSALAQFRQQNPAIMGQADSLAEAWCWMLARREWSSLIGLVTGEVLSEVVPVLLPLSSSGKSILMEFFVVRVRSWQQV